MKLVSGRDLLGLFEAITALEKLAEGPPLATVVVADVSALLRGYRGPLAYMRVEMRREGVVSPFRPRRAFADTMHASDSAKRA